MAQPVPLPPPRRHLFLAELAARRGINRWTVFHWLREKPQQLPPAFKLGGRIVFKIEDVEKWEDEVLVPYAPALPSVHTAGAGTGKKRGRPTKAESIAKRLALQQQEVAA